MSPKRRAIIIIIAVAAAGLFWSLDRDQPPARSEVQASVPVRKAAMAEPGPAPWPAGVSSRDVGIPDSLDTSNANETPSQQSARPITSTSATDIGGSRASASGAQTDASIEGTNRAASTGKLPPREAFDGFVPSEVQPLDMERTEATVADIHACIEAGGCAATDFGRGPGCTVGTELVNHPANCVTHLGARAYCRWIGARLPTAHEWIQEATDGGQRRWPWGDDRLSCARAVMRHGCGEGPLLPVCSRPLGNTGTGVCDLIGNVGEWTRTVRDGEARVMGEQVSRMLGIPLWIQLDTTRPDVGVRCVRDNTARASP